MPETVAGSLSPDGDLPLIRVKMVPRGPWVDDGSADWKAAHSQSEVDLRAVPLAPEKTEEPRRPNRDILPISTDVPILPTQSAEISAQVTGCSRSMVYELGSFVISNAGTDYGAADWIVNDLKINGVSQLRAGAVAGAVFSSPSPVIKIDTFVRLVPWQALDIVTVVVTYVGLNERGCAFFAALVGTVTAVA